jgi:hypothetical protein
MIEFLRLKKVYKFKYNSFLKERLLYSLKNIHFALILLSILHIKISISLFK